MKAVPVILKDFQYVQVEAGEATHIKLVFPGPISERIIPVVSSGGRGGTPNWSWNGNTERPTLRPSVLTRVDFGAKDSIICHSWVTDGLVHFLPDCTHSLKEQILPLVDQQDSRL